MALGNVEGLFITNFPSKASNKNSDFYWNKAFTEIIDSWLIEKIVLQNQTILLLY